MLSYYQSKIPNSIQLWQQQQQHCWCIWKFHSKTMFLLRLIQIRILHQRNQCHRIQSILLKNLQFFEILVDSFLSPVQYLNHITLIHKNESKKSRINSNKFNKMYFLMKGYLYSCIHTIVFHLQLIYMLDGDHSCNYHHTIWNQYLFLVLRSTPHKRFGLKITMSQWLINLLILLIITNDL